MEDTEKTFLTTTNTMSTAKSQNRAKIKGFPAFVFRRVRRGRCG
jgi:hypothetical protein